MNSKLSKKVMVYTMDYCPYCVRAKQLLLRRGVSFEEIKVDENDDLQWDQLYQRSGMKTLPQIYFGDQLIGGFNELSQLDQQDQLQSLKE